MAATRRAPMIMGALALLLGACGGTTGAKNNAVSSAPAVSLAPRHVVVVGDSVASGAHCDCPAYGSLVASDMQTIDGRPTIETNLATPGATTASLLEQLSEHKTVAALRQADMVLVTIGANDFEEATESSCAPGVSMSCFQPTLPEMSSRLGEILTTMRNLSNARVVVTGYWNVFLDGQQARARGAAYVRDADTLTREVNSVIQKRADLGGAIFADLYTAFKGDGDQDDTSLLATDGDHPNAQGHQVIAHVIDMQLGV